MNFLLEIPVALATLIMVAGGAPMIAMLFLGWQPKGGAVAMFLKTGLPSIIGAAGMASVLAHISQ